MPIDPDILIVLATVVSILSVSSILSAWVDGRLSLMAVSSLVIGLGIMGWVHIDLREGGLNWRSIPDAFIHVAAMMLG